MLMHDIINLQLNLEITMIILEVNKIEIFFNMENLFKFEFNWTGTANAVVYDTSCALQVMKIA